MQPRCVCWSEGVTPAGVVCGGVCWWVLLWFAGWTQQQIGDELGDDERTIRRFFQSENLSGLAESDLREAAERLPDGIDIDLGDAWCGVWVGRAPGCLSVAPGKLGFGFGLASFPDS